MSDDPKRMLDDLQGGDLKSLLEAGRSELPNENQMMGLAAKIGIAGGLGGLGGAGAAGIGGGGGAGAGAGAGAGGAGAKAVIATSVVKTGLVLKVGAALTVASAVGVGAVAISTREPDMKPPQGIVASAPVSAATIVASGSAPTRLTIVEPPPSDAPSASHVRPKPSADTSAEAEVKLLERAQDALRTKSSGEALTLCDEHARRFPSGLLVQEREVIAIEALVKAGRMADAKTRAARFKTRFPGSSHTRRIASLVGE
jgi:hypothetical protein